VPDRRVTLREASVLLGVSEGAIRKRVARKTIRSEMGEDGRRYVFVDDGADKGADASSTPESGALRSDDPLYEQMRERITSLERQLEQASERDRENRRIIAALTSRIPELEAPQEQPGASETVEEEPEGAEPQSATVEAQEELSAERTRREMAETTMHEGMTEERRRREESERERDDLRRELFNLRGRTEAHETTEEQQGRGQPHSDAPGTQERSRKPWWRRMFGS
jgi:hypothetical protein